MFRVFGKSSKKVAKIKTCFMAGFFYKLLSASTISFFAFLVT